MAFGSALLMVANIYASESFLKLVGLTQEQCSNFGWGDVLHPMMWNAHLLAVEGCVRTEGVCGYTSIATVAWTAIGIPSWHAEFR